jgi:hypothetical protein
VKRGLAVVLLLIGCKQTHAPAQAATPDLALPAGWSRGFGAAPAAPPTPQPPPKAAPATEADDDEPGVVVPPGLASRPAPRQGVALYVDGATKQTLSPADLALTKRLDAIAGAGARSMLAHGASGDLWLTAAELGRYQLRLNRRGQIKLEAIAAAGAGGGEHRDKGGSNAPPEHAGRQHELREVIWLEVRTRTSPHLAGEP